MNESPRELIGGRYQILTTLGRGGMGVVYKAYDPVLERDVAIKQMATSIVDSDEHRRRFQIEARAAARLNHPNIVTIYELEEHHGDIYIVMELLEGLSLGALLQRRTPPPLEAQLAILAQVCDGLDFAHSRAIVHRDIKPANLILLPSGIVKILDFGIAQLAASDLTRQGAVLGTPNYMAPEQVNGEQVDARADLFSVGAVAYELAAGVKAFSADSVPSLLMKIAEARCTPLSQVAPQTAPGLAALVARLLSKSRDDRPARGGEVRAALEQIGAVDRLELVADTVAEALSPSEGDTLIQLAPRERGTTPIASRSVVSPHRTITPTRPGAVVGAGDAGLPPPLPGAVLGGAVSAGSGSVGPGFAGSGSAGSGSAGSGQITQNLGPSEPPPLPPGLMPPSLPGAPSPASAASSSLPPSAVASASASGSTSAPAPATSGPATSSSGDAVVSAAPVAATGAIGIGIGAAGAAATGGIPAAAAPQPLVGAPAGASTPGAGAPGAEAAGPAESPQPASSAPRVTGAVPAARRASKGTAIIVLGLAAALFGIFIGASYMWWQRLRGEIKPHVTTASTAGQTPPAGSSTDTPSSSPASTTSPTGGEVEQATVAPGASATDGSATASPVAGASGTGASAAAEGTAPPSVDTASATTGASTPVTSASGTPRPEASGPGTSGPGTSGPGTLRPGTGMPGTAAPPASSVTPPPVTPPETRTWREPAPPVDSTPPPPPPTSASATPPAVRQSPDAPIDAPARPRSGEPPPRTIVDAETVSAFQRSGDATAVLGGDQTMAAAATVRIKDTLERYGKAIQERDLDTLRGLREPIAPAEQKLLDGPAVTVRFSDIDVDVVAPTSATAHARRTVTIAGQPPATDSVTVRLMRKPTGWVITSIAR